MKTIYTCFCTDVIHEGHLNIINLAKQYGEVIVGVLSDEAMVRYNRFPAVSFEDRVKMVEQIEGISKVVIQDKVFYDDIIRTLRPDYVIHGDNWKEGPMRAIRENVKEELAKYGGELIDAPYTYNETVRRIDLKMREKLAMPEVRRHRLKKMIKLRGLVKALEVHSGLTGLIAEKTFVEHNGEFDQWVKEALLCLRSAYSEQMDLTEDLEDAYNKADRYNRDLIVFLN